VEEAGGDTGGGEFDFEFCYLIIVEFTVIPPSGVTREELNGVARGLVGFLYNPGESLRNGDMKTKTHVVTSSIR